MRRHDADMLHCSLPALTTVNVSLVCLYLCNQHFLDHHGSTVAKDCSICTMNVCMCLYTVHTFVTYVHTLCLMTLHVK